MLLVATRAEGASVPSTARGSDHATSDHEPDLDACDLDAGDLDAGLDACDRDADDLASADRDVRDLDGVSETLDAEDDAAFDNPNLRDAIETGAAFSSTAFADASELEDLELRHHRPSRWGRLDVTIAWRRVWRPGDPVVSLAPGASGPLAPIEHTDTLWLLATWRK